MIQLEHGSITAVDLNRAYIGELDTLIGPLGSRLKTTGRNMLDIVIPKEAYYLGFAKRIDPAEWSIVIAIGVIALAGIFIGPHIPEPSRSQQAPITEPNNQPERSVLYPPPQENTQDAPVPPPVQPAAQPAASGELRSAATGPSALENGHDESGDIFSTLYQWFIAPLPEVDSQSSERRNSQALPVPPVAAPAVQAAGEPSPSHPSQPDAPQLPQESPASQAAERVLESAPVTINLLRTADQFDGIPGNGKIEPLPGTFLRCIDAQGNILWKIPFTSRLPDKIVHLSETIELIGAN